uniref:COesterase domain-containing protein n=1 Tax=Echinostoma caproni TaxID=27848 RepID=A0A183B2R1_9TREM
LQVWRGVPYARPPTRENNLRFRRPVPLTQTSTKYDATYFRTPCAQPDAGLTPDSFDWTKSPHEWAKRVPLRQTEGGWDAESEDCLYMNIYTLNETTPSDGARHSNARKKLPVLVIFDGMDHLTGTGNRYPGHALVQLGLVVVFVNYRLGPFGYLATEVHSDGDWNKDDSPDVARGNYGLWDQLMALEFIQNNIHLWLGDRNQVTVLGHGSGAADVALHMLSKHSGLRQPPLFHRAMLLSGADQMEGGFVRDRDESVAYSVKLAQQLAPQPLRYRLQSRDLSVRSGSRFVTSGQRVGGQACVRVGECVVVCLSRLCSVGCSPGTGLRRLLLIVRAVRLGPCR